MKIILSRKGFDSGNGRQASPILPDGTLLSLPIPSNDSVRYSDIVWHGTNYLEIIRQLGSKEHLNELSHCHLDPDLRYETCERIDGWMPAFGQMGAPLTELRNQGVTVGDLFLFFGWFKESEKKEGRLVYKRNAADLHIIYGYMQIGSIIEHAEDIPNWLKQHPHSAYIKDWDKGRNAIFLPKSELSFAPKISGCGTFCYEPKRVLTKKGSKNRSIWEFPKTMYGTPISHNPNGWHDGFFQSVGRGQEFIIDATPAVIDWVESLF